MKAEIIINKSLILLIKNNTKRGTELGSPFKVTKLFVFSLASRFRLFLTLYAGLLVMFSLAKLGKDAGASSCTLKATKSAVQGLAFLNSDFCHFFPSLRWLPKTN